MGERIDLAQYYLWRLGVTASGWAKIGKDVVRYSMERLPRRLEAERRGIQWLAASEMRGVRSTPGQDRFIRKTDPVVLSSFDKGSVDRHPTDSLPVMDVRIQRGLELLTEQDLEMEQRLADAVRETVQLLSLAPVVAATVILGPKTES